jgi:hypothetical protein
MLLLFAALIAAGDPGAEFSLLAGAGTRGERRAEATARAFSEGLSLLLGAIESEGPRAPQRQELLFGAEAGWLRGELRLIPQSAGLFRLAGEVGVHSGAWGLILGGRTVSLGRTRFRGLGARLELEGELQEGRRAGASASAWALSLDAPPSRDPWTTFGSTSLDWAQRWEAGAWASQELGDVSLTPALSLSQPAQPGVFEARAALGVELQLGPVRLRAEAGAARLFGPQLWMADVTAGLVVALR